MLQRRRMRKMLEANFIPESVAKLLRETKNEVRPPEVEHFQFVMILVDDTSPREVPTTISKVVAMLVRQGVTIQGISSSLVVGLLGVPFPEGDSRQARCELVGALLQDNDDRIRLVHGECDGAVGLFGSHERWNYGAVIPGFSDALKKLLETKLGTAIEVS